jgi:hypothetical protein
MERNVASRFETLEKAVARVWPAAKLVFAWEGSTTTVQATEVIELSKRDSVDAGLRIAEWLNEHMRRLGDDSVTMPWATLAIHELADHIEATASEAIDQVESLRLACRLCGGPFASRARGGRFARTCGRCFPYEPRLPEHARGGLIQVKRGPYPNRRKGQRFGVTEYATSVVCWHPDCLQLVLASTRDREYCDEHVGRREQARRLRAARPLKYERFQFTAIQPVTYCSGPRAEGVELVPGDRRWARDEEELLTLVQGAASGAFEIFDPLAPEKYRSP